MKRGPRSRKASHSSARRRTGRRRDRKGAARELGQVLKAQRESGEALRRLSVPITTEPALVFTPFPKP